MASQLKAHLVQGNWWKAFMHPFWAILLVSSKSQSPRSLPLPCVNLPPPPSRPGVGFPPAPAFQNNGSSSRAPSDMLCLVVCDCPISQGQGLKFRDAERPAQSRTAVRSRAKTENQSVCSKACAVHHLLCPLPVTVGFSPGLFRFDTQPAPRGSSVIRVQAQQTLPCPSQS